MQALLEWLKHSDAQTMAELSDKVHAQVSSLNSTSPSLSVRAGTDLFQRFVGRPHEASLPFESIKMKMLSEGAALVKACGEYREKTAQAGVPLIRDGMVVCFALVLYHVHCMLKHTQDTPPALLLNSRHDAH